MKEFTRILGPYRLRIVNSFENLVEKIIIFDSKLNDYAIEIMKFYFIENNPEVSKKGPWYYYGVEENAEGKNNVIFVSSKDDLAVQVPFDSGYKELEKRFNNYNDENKWIRTDTENVLKIMAGLLQK